ncbi:MAG: RNA 3'-terminal phosphate cyclase [Candidatus Altiarchaeota archaeon]
MIEIDGSFGEGGGQILRTAIAFSALTQEPVRIFNIRAKRQPSGLKAQHLTAVNAIRKLCDAEVSGNEIGSREIFFRPKEIKNENFSINVGTAGAITLVLQALMIPAINIEKKISVHLKGGTDVRWSPTIDYLRFVALPLLKKFGYNAEIFLEQRGYFPEGNGRVSVEFSPMKLKRIELTELGKILSLEGISNAHHALEKRNVARRQERTARTLLYNELCRINPELNVDIKQEYCNALSYGSALTLWIKTENSILGSCAVGEKNKSSEIVAQEASKILLEELSLNAVIDRHMADQIVPYLAIAKGEVLTSKITEHTKTNVAIVNKFGFNVKILDKKILSE